MTTKRLIAVLLALGRGEKVAQRSFDATVARNKACPECRMPTLDAMKWIALHGDVKDLPICACGWDAARELAFAEKREQLDRDLRRILQGPNLTIVPRRRSPIERLIDEACKR